MKGIFKKYLYKKKIEIPIYGGYLIILLSDSEKKVKKYIPAFNNTPSAHTWDYPYKNRKTLFVVLNMNSKDRITYGTIAHEAVHVATFLMEYRGIQASNVNDEAMAYLVGWVTNQITDFITKKGFKIK